MHTCNLRLGTSVQLPHAFDASSRSCWHAQALRAAGQHACHPVVLLQLLPGRGRLTVQRRSLPANDGHGPSGDLPEKQAGHVVRQQEQTSSSPGVDIEDVGKSAATSIDKQKQAATYVGAGNGSSAGDDSADIPRTQSGRTDSRDAPERGLAGRLRELRLLLLSSLRNFATALDNWWMRTAAVLAFVVAIVTCVVNFVLVPLVNYELLPTWQAAACQATMRKVTLGRCSWVSLSGVTGVVPLLRLGPTSIGPGPVEKSSLIARNGVALYLDPVASIMRQQVVLALQLDNPQATIVQGAGFSWLGYPEDTQPSARDLVPGLTAAAKKEQQHTQQAPAVSRKPSRPKDAAQQSSQEQAAAAARDEAAERVAVPPVALGHITLRFADVAILVASERVPRYLQYVTGELHLGPEYRSLELHLEADAHVRHVSSIKCTQVSPYAKRHIRHVTPGAANPPPYMFGCDNLPVDIRSRLQLRHVPSSAGYVNSNTAPPQHQQPHDGKDQAAEQGAANGQQQQQGAQQRQQSGRYKAGRVDGQLSGMPHDSGSEEAGTDLVSSEDYTEESAVSVEQYSGKLRVPVQHKQVMVVQGRDTANTRSLQPSGFHTSVQPLQSTALEGAAGSAGDPSQEESQLAGPAVVCSIHEYIRNKRGRGAEAAMAAGLPLTYSLRSHGLVLSDEDAAVAEQCAEAHLHAMRTGQAHVWPHAPWAPAAASSALASTAAGVSNDSAAVKEPAARSTRPEGGRLEVHLVANQINTPEVWPDMTVTIRAHRLHAPLGERLLELPMDIHEGRLSGELRIRTHDYASWQFPELYGRVQCDDIALHFWDATDDIMRTRMELVLERDRVYLHGAKGYFGAVPLSVTGDLDINPETGSFRLSATAAGVEANALRATLGIRPTPQAIAGAIRGILHCTGPLEQPVFSGSATAVRLPQHAYQRCEQTPALEAMLSTPGAVAAFDKVPIMNVSAVFTMDTSTARLTLHSAQGVPVGGGSVTAQGEMWLAPEAESNPSAINMQGEGSHIDTGALLSCYLAPEMKELLPSGTLSNLGLARVRGSMVGSHLAPEVALALEMPKDSRLLVSGSASFSPKAMSFTARGPSVSLDTTVLISSPTQALLRAADTQAEATHWARPRFEGIDLAASVVGLDILPLTRTTAAPALDPVSTGQPLRACCSGTVRCSLRPTAQQPATATALPTGAVPVLTAAPAPAATPTLVVAATAAGPVVATTPSQSSVDSQSQQQQPAMPSGAAGTTAAAPAMVAAAATPAAVVRRPVVTGLHSTHPSLMFTGPISLSNVRVNSLEVIRSLSGQAGVTGLGKVLLRTRGAATPSPALTTSMPLFGRPADQELLELDASAPELLPGLNLDATWLAAAQHAASSKESDEVNDSHMLLRRGLLLIDAASAGAGREYRLEVAGLPLDELEAGSLRGQLSSASLEANMEARQGRLFLALDSLRYASLAAERLTSAVRWEGDVVKLEEMVVVQQGSRYELAGEVFLPEVLAAAGSVGPSPDSMTATSAVATAAKSAPSQSQPCAAGGNPPRRPKHNTELVETGRGAKVSQIRSHQDQISAARSQRINASQSWDDEGIPSSSHYQAGRWRLAVNIPEARLQDLLPGTQLLSATQQPGSDYSAAKSGFLNALPSARLEAGGAGDGLPQPSGQQDPAAAALAVGAAGSAASSNSSVLPGLQELSGGWAGRIQVWGDVQGASNVEFSLQGKDWKWGAWRLDRLSVVGMADTDEGVVLEELLLASGPARASLRGALLGARQDAHLMVKDFPLHMLQPLYTLLPPALQGQVSEADARRGMNQYMRPFAGLSRRLESSMARLSQRLMGAQQSLLGGAAGLPEQGTEAGLQAGAPPPLLAPPGGPLSGLLFMQGWLGGSPSLPEASLQADIQQGAIGAVRLKQASAQMMLDAQQRVSASIRISPEATEGSLSVEGVAHLAKHHPHHHHHHHQTQHRRPQHKQPQDDLQKASTIPPMPVEREDSGSNQKATAGYSPGTEASNGSAGRVGQDAAKADKKTAAAEEQLLGSSEISEDGSASETISEPGFGLCVSTSAPSPAVQPGSMTPGRATTQGRADTQGRVPTQGRTMVQSSLITQGSAADASAQSTDEPEEELDVRIAVRDGGMALLSALVPACQWQSGNAALDVRVHGQLVAPEVQGSVRLSHAVLSSPVLKHPITQLTTDIQMTGSHMLVNHVDAQIGKLGRVRASGSLPFRPPPGLSEAGQGPGSGELALNLDNIELRVANTYSGMFDAALSVEGSAMAPYVGGSLTFSRGTLNLQPPAPTTAPAAAPITTKPSSSMAPWHTGSGEAAAGAGNGDAQLVQSAFSLLRAGRKRAALSHAHGGYNALVLQALGSTLQLPTSAMGGAGGAGSSPAGPSCMLAGLQVVLGPELRATFPVVLNMDVSGQITLHGPTDPLQIAPSGVIELESGSLNLVATQFTLDRQHANRILFFPEAGLLDPVLDIQLISGDLRAVVAGRGSNWQDALTLTASGTPLTASAVGTSSGAAAGSGVGGAAAGSRGLDRSNMSGGAAVEVSEVARVFEERLAEALLGENGQLALRSLASSTLHTLLPKLETRGQLGAARWRLVGAPALPHLLSVLETAGGAAGAPSMTDTLDPAKLLSRLAVGTELELMWGDLLTAALQHKLLNDGKIGTEARLTYRVTQHLRLSLQLQGLTRPSLTLGYTSEAL